MLSGIPVLSYAMAHCRVQVIDEIAVAHVGPDTRGATLEVDVVCAAGSLGGPRVLVLDLIDGRTTTLRAIDVVLDPARMLALDTQQPGRIVATLRDADGSTLAIASSDAQVLAASQWVAHPTQLAMEMLACHVQPNAAPIAALLLEASDRLRELTGDPSLNGYQSEDPGRVDAIVRCVFEAMAARDIRYAEPPASWGDEGQKVRTPSEVLEGRLGTCLDTTVTMAAALEQAGINSTVWLLRGHSFLGYWRLDASLAAVASVDIEQAMNLVDLGHIALVETTMLTGGPDSTPFAEATRAPRLRLDREFDDVLGVLDIRQARRTKILPLPSRSVGPDGQVVVSVYEAGPGPVIEAFQRGSSSSVSTSSRGSEPARVARWKNSLLDLSLRNHLIHYTDRSGYHLEVPATAIHRLEDQISAQVPITLVASDVVGSVDSARGIRSARDIPELEREVLLADKRAAFIDITSATYQAKLRYLAYKARTIVDETGSNNLYLVFGMLRWQLADRELRSPLILVPVTFTTTSRGQTYRITIDESGASTPNYCLLEKLRVCFGLEVPQLQNPAEDASGIDLAAAFSALRKALLAAGLSFRVEETVDLAILQFAKFPLWKDLDEHWEALSTNRLVEHLISTPLEAFVDGVDTGAAVDLDELGALVPVAADSSQLEAVHAAVEGRTFVLEGPPGTGKSQTITNLLARALVSGRRVLFVAEKRAALDVVKRRLSEIGLADLALDLHDKGARPSAVRAQIQAALDLQVRADHDALRTSGEAAQSARRRLSLYAERLHEPNRVGHSLYSAHAYDLASDHSIPAMHVPRAFVESATSEGVEQVLHALRGVPEHADLARPRPQHPWRFVDEPVAPDSRAQVVAAAGLLDAALAGLAAAGLGPDQWDGPGSSQEAETWARLAGAPRHPIEAIDALHAPGWRQHLESLGRELATLADEPGSWRSTVLPEVMDRDVAAIHRSALAADASGFFGRKRRRRAVLAQFEDLLQVPVSEVDLRALSTLTGGMASTFARVTAVREAIQRIPLPLTDSAWNPAVPEHAARARQEISWLLWTGDTLAAERTAAEGARPGQAELRQYFATSPRGSLGRELAELAAAWSGLARTGIVAGDAARVWAGADGFLRAWWRSRGERAPATPASLQHWVDLLQVLEPLRRHGLVEARSALLDGAIRADDAVLAFHRGLALGSLEERRDATALADFDISAHDRTIERFTAATHAVRRELPRALPEQVLASRRFNAGAATGQMGGLRRQLQRQRGGMSVRALLDNYGELITQIMPCTLMSPQSVARFFPARAGLFDIVVFDEASQIRVADAVGAMGRARSVVIVGDSKQMPPTQFAEASLSVEDAQEPLGDDILDEESILSECVQARVPSRWLSWHYRSQDESLIAFSNRHYYDNRLSSFPAPLPRSRRDRPDGCGISLVRVNGTFERSGRGRSLRTNRVEAEAIVEDVQQRFWRSPGRPPSLGIITFNVQQRNLIENLLRDSGDERIVQALDEPDGLFVKNLENVQGDERDCILFSVAFSANDRGVVPLNFGPLSRPGGERRLNVAVTRARRQVVLYASFDPAQLRAEETTQVGTKHLKAYLELAVGGVDAVQDDGHRPRIVDRHRDDIADELRRAGLAVTTDVGLSDFRVDIAVAVADQPDQPLLAILLDGPGWRARRTVADRDALPVDVLKAMMRWPGVERVWLPEWMQDRAGTLVRLVAATHEACARSAASGDQPDTDARRADAAPAAPPTPSPAGAADRLAEPAAFRSQTMSAAAAPRTRHPLLRDYVEWTPGRLGDRSVLDDLPHPTASRRVAGAAGDAIEAEGPIHPDRLARLVANAFDLRRVSEDRKESILRAIGAHHKPGVADGFYWPRSMDPGQWALARVPAPGQARPIEEIALRELANSMRIVAEETGGMCEDDMMVAALNLFGGRRRTDAVRARLSAGLAFGLKHSLIESSSRGYYRAAARKVT